MKDLSFFKPYPLERGSYRNSKKIIEICRKQHLSISIEGLKSYNSGKYQRINL